MGSPTMAFLSSQVQDQVVFRKYKRKDYKN